MCLNQDQLDSISSSIKSNSIPSSFILIGYNRRFSPHTLKAKNKFVINNNTGVITNTRISATVNIKEKVIHHNWLLDTVQGSRNMGETCHM